MLSRWDARVARSMVGCEVDMHSGRLVADYFSRALVTSTLECSTVCLNSRRARSSFAVFTGGVRMARNDWLIGGDARRGAERIYAAATDLVSRSGFENFSIDALAVWCIARVHYLRNAGGKKAILEAVTMRMSARVSRRCVRRSRTCRVLSAWRRLSRSLGPHRAELLGSLIMGSISQPRRRMAHGFSRGR